MLSQSLLVSFAFLVSVVGGANILGVFFIPSISHQVMFQPIWKELSLRGHQVTVLTPDPLKDPSLTNLTEIDLGLAYDFVAKFNLPVKMAKENSVFTNILILMEFFKETIVAEVEHAQVQELLNDETRGFDLVLVECLHPLVYGFAGKFKAPVVGVLSLTGYLQNYDAVGNPTHPVANPDFLLTIEGEMGLYDRIRSTMYSAWYRVMYYWWLLPESDRIARQYFGEDLPYLGDIERNTSLLLVNSNPVVHPTRANVPAVIELGQVHINKKKALPSDLQSFLDKSSQGVVYFNLGSNVKSASLTDSVRQVIVQALGELPYNVLWKWETDHLPGQPKNVMIKKWLPQQDLLGHRNIKVFVTQAGLQSMEEGIVNGVPMVGMPFFGDQPLNVVKMVDMGIAVRIDFKSMTKESLKTAIIGVAEDDRYRKKVQYYRELLLDQPMTGLEKAVWWIEYAIRHKGAHHLRSPTAVMPWYQYHLLDVALAILAALGVAFVLPYVMLRRLL